MQVVRLSCNTKDYHGIGSDEVQHETSKTIADSYPPPPRDDTCFTPFRSYSLLSKKTQRKNESQLQHVAALSPTGIDKYKALVCASTPTTINDSPLSPPTSERRSFSPQRLLRKMSLVKTRMISHGSNSTPSSLLNSERLYHSAPTSPTSKDIDESQIKSLSPIVQDLLKLQQETPGKANNALSTIFLPTLAKPRATSFLTGQEELFRSSENDPTDWQLEIPCYDDVYLCAKLCQYLANLYSNTDHGSASTGPPIDNMRQSTSPGKSNLVHHCQAVATCLRGSRGSFPVLDVKEFFTSNHDNIEKNVLIVDIGNKFICVFGAVKDDKNRKTSSSHNTMLLKDGSVVFESHYNAFAALQLSLFERLDKLTDESPFCDVSFTGHNDNAAIATIAAHIYANTRPTIRVSCLLFEATKLSPTSAFRCAAHSTSNLNICQVDYASKVVDARQYTSDRVAIGHRLQLTHLPGKGELIVQAFKFGCFHHIKVQQQIAPLATVAQLKKFNDVANFVLLLERVERNSWVQCSFLDNHVTIS